MEDSIGPPLDQKNKTNKAASLHIKSLIMISSTHLATLHLSWLPHIFNSISCYYQAATQWDLLPLRIIRGSKLNMISFLNKEVMLELILMNCGINEMVDLN